MPHYSERQQLKLAKLNVANVNLQLRILASERCRSSQVYDFAKIVQSEKDSVWPIARQVFQTDLTEAIVIHSSQFHCFAVAYCLLGVTYYAVRVSE